MDSPFRICIYGRFYEIPSKDISSETLAKLKNLTDDSGNVNPRDLLVAFLESSEETQSLKQNIQCAITKLKSR